MVNENQIFNDKISEHEMYFADFQCLRSVYPRLKFVALQLFLGVYKYISWGQLIILNPYVDALPLDLTYFEYVVFAACRFCVMNIAYITYASASFYLLMY